MRVLKSSAKPLPNIAKVLALPLLVSGFLWLTSVNQVSWAQLTLAFLLLLLPWATYLNWRRHRTGALPVFPLLAFMYWVYYVPALFWTNIAALNKNFYTTNRVFSEESVTATLLLALLGVCCLWAGMRSGLARGLRPRSLPFLSSAPRNWNYLRVVFVITSLASVGVVNPYALGDGGRQIIIIATTFLPLVIFAILYQNYLRGKSSALDKRLLLGFVALRLIIGLASGWLGQSISFGLVCAFIYIIERGQLPRLVLTVLIPVVAFLQVGKSDFRDTYWGRGEQGVAADVQVGTLERVTSWLEFSLTSWGNILTNPGSDALINGLAPTISRISLLGQAANVLELTPNAVPYQYGRLYYYMLVTLVPRAVWPDKPSVSEANRFYQVAYGMTEEENLGATSIAIGVLVESYISFGWWGGVAIMFLLGIFFDFYQRVFLVKESGVLVMGIGVALMPSFLVLEAQMAQYLAGTIQYIFLTLLLLLPVWKKQSVERLTAP